MADIITVIVEGTLVRGRLSGDEDVIVAGRLEGEIALSRALYVEETGVVIANVAVEQAVIGGTVVGDVYARTGIQVAATGRVVGELRAPRIVVAEGATLKARLDTESTEAVEKRVDKPAPTVAKPGRAPRVARPFDTETAGE